MTDARDVIAARAAQELHSGEVVNLGIGIPNRIPGFLDPDVEIFLHTENGLLGVGSRPAEGEVDLELIDAGKKPVTLMPGAAAFGSIQSPTSTAPTGVVVATMSPSDSNVYVAV